MGDENITVGMENGTGQIEISDPSFQIDPMNWILKEILETSVETARDLPVRSELSSVFPNPFNQTVTLKLVVSKNEHVTLEIFNSQGQSIDCLLNQIMRQGTYNIRWTARTVPSGVYFIHFISPSGVQNRKLVLLK